MPSLRDWDPEAARMNISTQAWYQSMAQNVMEAGVHHCAGHPPARLVCAHPWRTRRVSSRSMRGSGNHTGAGRGARFSLIMANGAQLIGRRRGAEADFPVRKRKRAGVLANSIRSRQARNWLSDTASPARIAGTTLVGEGVRTLCRRTFLRSEWTLQLRVGEGPALGENSALLLLWFERSRCIGGAERQSAPILIFIARIGRRNDCQAALLFGERRFVARSYGMVRGRLRYS